MTKPKSHSPSSPAVGLTTCLLLSVVVLHASLVHQVLGFEGETESTSGGDLGALRSALGSLVSSSGESAQSGTDAAGSAGLGGRLNSLLGSSKQKSGGVADDVVSAAMAAMPASGSTGSASSEGSATEELDIFNDPGEFIKTMLNPAQFVRAISAKFQLSYNKLVGAIGKPLVFGLEAALTPFSSILKIVEKIFVPDQCRLHFICKLGSNLSFIKAHVPKFSAKFGEGSSLIRSFGDGLLGIDCAHRYTCEAGEPKLKKEFESLKKDDVSV